MKILLIYPLIGRTTIELAGFCKNAFESLGHRTCLFEYKINSISSRIPILGTPAKHYLRLKLCREICRFRPHLVLVIKGDRIPISTIVSIRQQFHISVANYWIDDPFRIGISSKISPYYDYFFTTDTGSVQIHKQAGCPRVGLLTYGADPTLHKRMSLSEADVRQYGSDICFAGTISAKRMDLLQELADFDIKIWASRHVFHLRKDYTFVKEPILPNAPLYDKFAGRAVWGEELVKVYNASKIVLNIHDPQTCPIMRDFEVPACGSFLLTDSADRLAEMYTIGTDIVCFKDKGDLRKLAKYYLNHPNERSAIAQLGYERVCADHFYRHRMQELISFVNHDAERIGSRMQYIQNVKGEAEANLREPLAE